MKRKVVIIGAGFSAPIGIPLMRGFFAKMEETYKDPSSGLGGHENSLSNNKINDKEEFRLVLERWTQWATGKCTQEADDLEAFCSYVSSDANMRNSVLYCIARLFEIRMHPLGNLGLRSGPWKSLYRQFANDVGRCCDTITVVTLNQDLLLDQAFLQEGYCPDYCLPKDTNLINEINVSQKKGDSLQLLKLHGSMNWLRCDNPACRLLTVKWQREGSLNCPGNWPTGPEQHEGHISKDNLHFLMVLPEHQKSAAPEDVWLGSVKSSVEAAFRQADEVFFLGYSLPETDEDMIRLMSSSKVQCRHVCVVDRCYDAAQQSNLKNRYKDAASAGDALEFCLGDEGDIALYEKSTWRQQLLAGCP